MQLAYALKIYSNSYLAWDASTGLTITYKASDDFGAKKSIVTCMCDATLTDDPKLVSVGESPTNTFNFDLTHACCCPGKCEAEISAGGVGKGNSTRRQRYERYTINSYEVPQIYRQLPFFKVIFRCGIRISIRGYVCRSVRRSVGPSVRPSVPPSVGPHLVKINANQ